MGECRNTKESQKYFVLPSEVACPAFNRKPESEAADE
jgi:hypothetical protein